MFTTDPSAFVAAVRALPPLPGSRTTARAIMLVAPHGFRVSDETARDNAYMTAGANADGERALAQHALLAQAIAADTGLPVQVFPGDPATPDACFPNNVFATARGRLLLGAMRHPERRREAERADIPAWFAEAFGYPVERLPDAPGHVAELTGALIIDHARGIGVHGLTERCTLDGARAMHEAFGLRASLATPLAGSEYHTNVVMSILAGRALVIHAPSFTAPGAADAIASLWPDDHVLWLTDTEKAAFVGNCIALTSDQVWMSARAERALTHANRLCLRRASFDVHTVGIDEIERAGGSLRCCVCEVY
jgi:hypothetical protein